jgi:outer membrane protein OmpA-like peptidoglycan-associated protein
MRAGRRGSTHFWAAASVVCLMLGAGGDVAAQSESVQDMIQQLQGKRTRSMRNLNVEPVAPSAVAGEPANGALPPPSAAAPAEARPSISLLIQFDFDSATVRPESLPSIERLTRAIGSPELASYRFAIEGHTDARGRPEYNQRLSERRAQRVRDILIQGGVDPERLTAIGKGSAEPANAFDPHAPENRRVKIVNLN